MRWERQNRSRPDTGATGTEYAALVLVSIAVIVGVLATLTPGLLAPRAEDAVCTAFQDQGCEAPPPSGQSDSVGDTPGTGGPAGPPDDRQGSPWDPRNRGPHWNDAFTGMTPASALLQGFGRQVGDLGRHVLQGRRPGNHRRIWSDLVGIKDLVVHPIDSAQGVWWAITNPTESLPMLVWDDESRQDWGDGKKVKARKEAEAAARQLRAAERAQKVKDIDGALQAKRYEDADNFSDDLETMAKDAEARAAKDPTPENKKEAHGRVGVPRLRRGGRP